MDELGNEKQLIAIPKGNRAKILSIAHDKLVHLGKRKVLRVISRSFIWQLLARHLTLHVKSYAVCLRCDKQGHRKVPLAERRTITEPFQIIRMDIVSPLQTFCCGNRHILTSICRYPLTMPLRNVKASTVAQGMNEICSNTNFPLEALTEQGTQFTGELFNEVMSILGVHHSCAMDQ